MKAMRIYLGVGLLVALMSPVTVSKPTTGQLRLTPNDGCAESICKVWFEATCENKLNFYGSSEH